jgi:hypothetical protein
MLSAKEGRGMGVRRVRLWTRERGKGTESKQGGGMKEGKEGRGFNPQLK